MQIVGRKAGRDPAELEAHAAAMARVGDALSSALGAMLAAPGAQEELAGGEDGAGGPTEEHARRLAGVLATLADNHWTLLRDQQQQHTLLRHVRHQDVFVRLSVFSAALLLPTLLLAPTASYTRVMMAVVGQCSQCSQCSQIKTKQTIFKLS